MLHHNRVSIFVSLSKEIIFYYFKILKHHMSFLLAQMKELKKTYFHSFSGAENEPRDIHPLPNHPLYGVS
jgi:hypothetical protein